MVSNGLPEAAVAYAEARFGFAVAEQDGELAAKWAVRAMEAAALSAMTRPSEAGDFDAKQQQYYDVFERTFPEHRRLPWLQWQQVRCKFLRAQSRLARYLAAPGNAQPREQTLALVRDINADADALKQDIRRRLAVAAGESPRGGREAPAEQLMQLSFDADLLLSESLLLRAQAYPLGSQDYQAAMGQVDLLASEALQESQAGWTGQEKLQLGRAAAGLALGRLSESTEELRRLATTASLSETRNQAAWTLLNHLSRQGRLSEARQYAGQLPKESPLTLLAEMTLRIAEAKTLASSQRDSAMKQILELCKEVGSEHGDYWQNRADALIAATGDTVSGGGSNSPDLMQVQVKQFLAAGQNDKAIELLRQRLQQDITQANGEHAIQVATQLAALQYREGRITEASETAGATASRFSPANGAAALDRFALVLTQASLSKDLGNKQLASDYSAELREHLALWPDSATATEVMDWLQRWAIGRKEFTELLTTLQATAGATSIPETRASALKNWAIAICLASDEVRNQHAESLRASDTTGAVGLAAFISLLDRWQVEQDRKQDLAAVKKRSVASDHPQGANDSVIPWGDLWVLVNALEKARSQNITRASSVAEAFDRVPLPITRFYLSSLVEAIDLAGEATRQQWAQALGLDETIANFCIESKQLADRAVGYRILQWSKAGDRRAVDEIAQLRKMAPRDGELLLQLAEALAEQPDGLKQSSEWARTVAANSPAQTPMHLRAQWRRMRNMILAGDAAGAKQAAKLLLATSPPSDPIWRRRIEQLAE